MAEGSLSQEEIDALLKGTEDVGGDTGDIPAPDLSGGGADLGDGKSAADELASLADLAGIDPAMSDALSASLERYFQTKPEPPHGCYHELLN
jgi:flagellar motor switch protein FliM